MKFVPLKAPRDLVIHRDGSLSVRVKRGRKWKWEHHARELSERDFKRLIPEEQAPG